MIVRPGRRPVAIGARLKSRPEILTLGFRPDFTDYSPREQERLLGAKNILYPTAFYADLFNAMGKQTFPSFHTYKFAQDKIRQSAIFAMQKIPHPRTRVFYTTNPQQDILAEFDFPFVAKAPRGSARGRGVFLIRNPGELTQYLSQHRPAYIQEYLPEDKDMRIIVIKGEVALGFWRFSTDNEFRTNISMGGRIAFDPLPQAALDLALTTAARCGWDDVGIDIIEHRGGFFVLEGNMKYGTQGFQAAGMDYKRYLVDRILNF